MPVVELHTYEYRCDGWKKDGSSTCRATLMTIAANRTEADEKARINHWRFKYGRNSSSWLCPDDHRP